MWIYYDTETTGKCHPFDQILQIAAIVTSKKWREFETINDRCRLRPDVIPTPEAMLITRQRPSDLNDKSRKTHYEMFDDYDRFLKERIISQKDRGGDLNGYTRERPITFKGHNILAFDEYAYRMDTHMTLHNPYIHMMEGCARFDTLVAAQAIAIYGSGKMRFPLTEKGNLSFRLGAMCEVNDIVVDHSDLHDALADVRYTIKLDEKMAKSEPELYYQLDLMANKQDVRAFCEKNEVFSYSLMHFGKPKTGFFTSIANEDDRSRKTSNDQLMWDLSQDPEEYFDKSVEELSEFFSKSKKGNAFKMRSAPVLWCRRNEQPMMMPMNLVSESFKEGYIQEAQEDGGVKSLSSVESEDVMHERAQKIKNNPVVVEDVGPVVGHVQVVTTVVVDVAHGDAGAPATVVDASRGAAILKDARALVVHQLVPGTGSESFRRGAIDHIEVEMTVAIVVEEGGAAAVGLEDVAFLQAAEDVGHVDTRCRGLVREEQPCSAIAQATRRQSGLQRDACQGDPRQETS